MSNTKLMMIPAAPTFGKRLHYNTQINATATVTTNIVRGIVQRVALEIIGRIISQSTARPIPCSFRLGLRPDALRLTFVLAPSPMVSYRPAFTRILSPNHPGCICPEVAPRSVPSDVRENARPRVGTHHPHRQLPDCP